MQIKKVWKVSKGKGVTVAVIDSGVSPATASLRGQVLPGKDFASAPGDETTDDSGHGTTMAELIAGTGKAGALMGMAPDAKIVPYRIGIESVKGREKGAFTGTPEAIRAAADSEAQIINMSFGEVPYDELRDALDYAASKGKLLFAPTGNDAQKNNGQTGDYPASHTSVSAIASYGKDVRVSKFSSHGDHAVTFAAPGEELIGWCNGKFDRYCAEYKGTSAASAITSGAAALVWAKHPKWTANQVLRVLIDTAGRANGKKNTISKYIGNGAIRPRMNLVEGEGKPGDPDISPLTNKRVGPSAEKSSDASKSEKADDAPGKVKAADSASGGDGDSGSLLPILGVGAGVVVLAGGGFAFVRMRRKNAA